MKLRRIFQVAALLFGVSAWAQTTPPEPKPTFDIDRHLVPDSRLPAPPTIYPTTVQPTIIQPTAVRPNVEAQDGSSSKGSFSSTFSNWFPLGSSSSRSSATPLPIVVPTNTPDASPSPTITPKMISPTAIPISTKNYSPLAFKEGVKAANRGDFKAARSIWEPLAAMGDKNAQYDLGRMYARGDGVSRDYAKARQYFEAAAAKDQPAALYSLGLMYYNGDGVVANRAKAIEYYRRAEALGNESASYALKRLGDY